ncbi:mitochondrial import protein 2 [[Candida] jaroonii]|uniref:Mitochondrial import protein 2 n=1 Tax=[Candida] jaroonii TaxID=467808 RepID=A0ACA9YES1_9ASCO|nr:mitochondrial import protein 2 [[Candida] jaroonii]
METEEEFSDYESEYGLSAQEQWEESMKQINGLVNWIIVPLIGKILGRRVSKIIWARIAGGL